MFDFLTVYLCVYQLAVYWRGERGGGVECSHLVAGWKGRRGGGEGGRGEGMGQSVTEPCAVIMSDSEIDSGR